jgi:hypothetical protein
MPDPVTVAGALDHVVVVLFENRSFDNVLGHLYGPGDGKTFEGVIGKELTNPIPDWAEHGAERKVVPYTIATDMDSPNPDSGEEWSHTNTQLFGVVDEQNRFKIGEQVGEPWNAPPAGATPTMDGFVMDYISTFTGEIGRQPTYEEYAHIMSIHYSRLKDRLATNVVPFAEFERDAAAGALPDFSFIEPNFINGHGDYHPAFGEAFTERDASARTFDDLFTLDKPRDPQTWVTITALPVPASHLDEEALAKGLSGLGKSMGQGIIEHARQLGLKLPPQLDNSDGEITPELIELIRQVAWHYFPLLATEAAPAGHPANTR